MYFTINGVKKIVSFYWGIRYKERRYIEVPLYFEIQAFYTKR